MSKKNKDVTLFNIYRPYSMGRFLQYTFPVYVVTTDNFDKWYENTKGTSYIVSEDGDETILEIEDFDVEPIVLVTLNK